MALTRFASAAFARTVVIARADACPGGEAGSRVKAAHVGANCGEDHARRSLLHPRQTVQLLDLRGEGSHECSNLLVAVPDLALEQIDEVQGALEKPRMMVCTLSLQRSCK